jgi:hypothetical protein
MEHHGKMSGETLIKTHEIFHGGSYTKVGTRLERLGTGTRLLETTQERSADYRAVKRYRVQQEMCRIVAALRLPRVMVYNGMHVHDRLEKAVTPGTMLAGEHVLACVSLYYASKVHDIALFKSEMLAVTDVSSRRFKACLMRASRALKRAAPRLHDRCRRATDHVLRRCSLVLREMGGGRNALKMLALLWKISRRELAGFKEQSKVGILAYLALRLGKNEFELSKLAEKVGYAPSSLYNSTSRLLEKLGVPADGTLSRVDIHDAFHETGYL